MIRSLGIKILGSCLFVCLCAGDMSDHLYIILNGRIRTIIEGKEGTKSVSGEFGKGELIGIAEVITRTKR